MAKNSLIYTILHSTQRYMRLIAAVCMLLCVAQLRAEDTPQTSGAEDPETTPKTEKVAGHGMHYSERELVVVDELSDSTGSLQVAAADTLAILDGAQAQADEWVPRKVEFAPDPTRAVWLSALFPGLGQIYNRRYWKLPIIVGGYLGLAYATNWNNTMLNDYTRAYSDLLDNDPDTRSYMDFFSPNVKEENLDRSWLQNVMRSRKNYFRRNRDLCIISMVGVYLLAMVDAYVDASLSHFDISPDLSMDLYPSLIQDGRQRYPSVGLLWAVNF